MGTSAGRARSEMRNCEITCERDAHPSALRTARDGEEGCTHPVAVDRRGVLCETLERADALHLDGGLGRGIGLALVRAAVARRGGTVLASAAVPHGARFVVALPAALPLEVPS